MLNLVQRLSIPWELVGSGESDSLGAAGVGGDAGSADSSGDAAAIRKVCDHQSQTFHLFSVELRCASRTE